MGCYFFGGVADFAGADAGFDVGAGAGAGAGGAGGGGLNTLPCVVGGVGVGVLTGGFSPGGI